MLLFFVLVLNTGWQALRSSGQRQPQECGWPQVWVRHDIRVLRHLHLPLLLHHAQPVRGRHHGQL